MIVENELTSVKVEKVLINLDHVTMVSGAGDGHSRVWLDENFIEEDGDSLVIREDFESLIGRIYAEIKKSRS